MRPMYVRNLPVTVDTMQNHGFQAIIVDLFILVGSDGFTPQDGHGRVARNFYPVFEHRRLDGRKVFDVGQHVVIGILASRAFDSTLKD